MDQTDDENNYVCIWWTKEFRRVCSETVLGSNWVSIAFVIICEFEFSLRDQIRWCIVLFCLFFIMGRLCIYTSLSLYGLLCISLFFTGWLLCPTKWSLTTIKFSLCNIYCHKNNAIFCKQFAKERKKKFEVIKATCIWHLNFTVGYKIFNLKYVLLVIELLSH